ncbi:MAG: hypothetical protein KAR42_17600 [candidate division Zixibacteria bacterium]|nr:hypothetical protein [candidate division Zixibacteria bacterium]
MFKKIAATLLVGMLMTGSVSASWLGAGFQRLWKTSVTSSITLESDSTSCETVISDTSDVSQWMEMDGGIANLRFRFRKDTIFTAAVDTYFVYVETSPTPSDADSANLFQTLYTLTDASPSATNEYTSFLVNQTDSSNYHRFWRYWFVTIDSVGETNDDTLTAGNTYSDTLEMFIENWE